MIVFVHVCGWVVVGLRVHLGIGAVVVDIVVIVIGFHFIAVGSLLGCGVVREGGVFACGRGDWMRLVVSWGFWPGS